MFDRMQYVHHPLIPPMVKLIFGGEEGGGEKGLISSISAVKLKALTLLLLDFLIKTENRRTSGKRM